LRRQQLEAWKKAEGKQPALFELRDDYRPQARAWRRAGIGSQACSIASDESAGFFHQTDWSNLRRSPLLEIVSVARKRRASAG
jgi:hypothetical protein